MNRELHVLSTGLGLFQLSNIQLITTIIKELVKLHTVEGKGTSYQTLKHLHRPFTHITHLYHLLCASLLHTSDHNAVIQSGKKYICTVIWPQRFTSRNFYLARLRGLLSILYVKLSLFKEAVGRWSNTSV